ncbi:MAG: hypothetical protein H6619_04635 [Deltaproteobacteria bacterium]|nr:hypothetical protein [Deltaproteobacteria bacterium]
MFLSRSLFRISLLVFVSAVSASYSLADEVMVDIRAIHASRGDKPYFYNQSKLEEVSISDMESKLRKLQYDHFHLLASEHKNVEFNHKEVLHLPQGHTLSFKPIARKDDRIQLWLNWTNDQGAELLDTQLHLISGESMITGTEESDDQGLIVEISVK